MARNSEEDRTSVYSIQIHIARIQSQSKRLQQGMKSGTDSCTQI